MAFGILYPLTATGTALPVADAADATDGRGRALADRATATACGVDGAMSPPPPPPQKHSQAKHGFVTIALQPKPSSPPETSPQGAGTPSKRRETRFSGDFAPQKRRETCSTGRITPPRAAQTAFQGQKPLPQPAQPAFMMKKTLAQAAQPHFKTKKVLAQPAQPHSKTQKALAQYETFVRTLNEVIKKYSVKMHKHKHGEHGGESSGE